MCRLGVAVRLCQRAKNPQKEGHDGSSPALSRAMLLCEDVTEKQCATDLCVTDNLCNVESREPAPAERSNMRDSSDNGVSSLAPGGVVLHSPFLFVCAVIRDLFPWFGMVISRELIVVWNRLALCR